MEKKRSVKDKAAASAVAAVTAAGVLVGGAFADPDDILSNDPDAIVQTMDAGSQIDDDGGAGPGDGEEEEEESRRSLKGGVRRIVRAAPVEVRALVAVPLWALGTVVIALVSTLWTAVLSPVAATALSWLGFALMAVLIFALAAKTVFPNMPLKKILNKRSILTIVILCFACGILDSVLPFFWEDYQTLSKVLKIVGSLICTGVPVAFFVRRHKKKAAEIEEVEAEPVEPELTMEEKEAAARKLIEEMADSVCPRTAGR